jgi:tetratricopeptide (TPR) repeat protein
VRKYYGPARDTQWLQKATQAGRRAVAANDDLAAGHVALGMALAASGQNAEAAVEFERARELNPLSGPAHLGLARLGGREAEQLFRRAIELSPRDWIPVLFMAIFLHRNARYDESVELWQKALALSPDNVLVMVYLAAAVHMQGKYGEAADLCQQALTLDSTNPETWANLGTARYFQARYLDSVRAFEKAVELAPDRYMYWGNLGDSYRRIEGSANKAVEAYKRAIRLVREQLAVSQNERYRSSLAVYLARTGDTSGALAEVAALEKTGATDKATHFKVALVYEAVDQRDQALTVLALAIRGGYAMHEIANEPELAALRADPRYLKIINQPPATKKR